MSDELKEQVYDTLHMYWGPENDGSSLTEQRVDKAIALVRADERKRISEALRSDQACREVERVAWEHLTYGGSAASPHQIVRSAMKVAGLTEGEGE